MHGGDNVAIRDTILITDDSGSSRAILKRIFGAAYNLLEAENGEQALFLLEQNKDCIAAVLLDIIMPVKDGYTVLEEMNEKGLISKIPVVVITSVDSNESETRALKLGAADIITKPYDQTVVQHRVKNIVDLYRHKWHLEELVDEQSQMLRQTNEIMVDALSSIIEHRSVESGQHIMRIRRFTKILLEEIAENCPEYELDKNIINTIAAAAALHDIGKISIPDAILNKPGRLTEEEFEVMKNHTTAGCDMLEAFDGLGNREYLYYAHNICRYHHERWDGNGYPDKLKGDGIPICAQVVGLADAYDALTTNRVYKPAFTHEKSASMIMNGECGVFSPVILECFKKVCGKFAELAKYYADGHSPRADDFDDEISISAGNYKKEEGAGTLEILQAKYQTLMHYLNAAVMEVDIDKKTHHLIYNPCPELSSLNVLADKDEAVSGEDILNAYESIVHPDDRHVVREFTKYCNSNLFTDDVKNCGCRYRIIDRETGEYHKYDVEVVRVDIDDEKLHKVMSFWRPVEHEQTIDENAGWYAIGKHAVEGLIGTILRCKNDKYCTIVDGAEDMAALTGSTKDENFELYQNSLLEMILPEDREKFAEQIKAPRPYGAAFSLEYRVRERGGDYIWVRDRRRLVNEADGQEYFYCLLTDITQIKKTQEKLSLLNEERQIIMHHTSNVIFDWDITNDTVKYSDNWKTIFGYELAIDQMSTRIMNGEYIHPDDKKNFLAGINSMLDNDESMQEEFRLCRADGEYVWCAIRASMQKDENGTPLKIVGVLVDINESKCASLALKEKAERDGLTGLLNKASGRTQIEEYLADRRGSADSALLVVDLDNFKLVNDNYGHLFGDVVLTQAAEGICGTFRRDDIVSRIGGDEFMVLLKDVPNRAMVKTKADRLLELFDELFGERLKECGLSCSVGICYAEESVLSYQDMFKRADQALYMAKRLGKNCSAFFADTPDEIRQKRADKLSTGTEIDSNERPVIVNNSLVYYAFRRMHEAENLNDAIKEVLALVGQQSEVSRAYIFENSADDTYCSNTFEWCAEGIVPEIYNLQHVNYSDMPELMGLYDEQGVFYCVDITKLPSSLREILEPQGIKSLLHCAITENGKFKGYVGFDDCRQNRIWTKDEIAVLNFLSEMISVFLLKKRAQDEKIMQAENLQTILDNQNAPIYVINPETCELLFINERTRSIAPDAKPGMLCYDALMACDTRCEECPALDIVKNKNKKIYRYTPKYDLHMMSNATHIRWNNEDACLIHCRLLKDDDVPNDKRIK